MRFCKECEQDKPLTDFAKDSKGKGGYRPRCRQCEKEYRIKLRKPVKIKSIRTGDIFSLLKGKNYQIIGNSASPKAHFVMHSPRVSLEFSTTDELKTRLESHPKIN